VASHHPFWELDWRLKLALGLMVVVASLCLVRAPGKQPVHFAVAIFGLELGTLVAVRGIVAADAEKWWQFALPFALVLIPAIFSAVALSRLGWWRVAGFTRPRDWRRPWIAAILALTLVLPLLGLSGHGMLRMSRELLALQVAFLVIGVFMEETIYRGLVLAALLRYGAVWASVGSGILFGLSHIDNLFLPGSELGVAYQVLEAGLMGVLFGAVRLRMNTIWTVMVAHVLYDFILVLAYGHAVPVQPTIAGFTVVTVVNLALAAGGLVLVRRQPTFAVARVAAA
jgi:membrane protease YdiL (CAAX protease family)